MAKNIQCPKCDRTFNMPAHLARHMSTMHISAAKKAAKKRGAKKRRKKGGWPKGKKRGRGATAAKRGPGRVIGGVRVSSLSLDQLSDLITAARDEARRKISDLTRSLG